ncbi:hypothetical protein BKI51_02615 [Alphaproteobacteria bacterium AO1-B]|nr:hypothetical protein BKI51_02615 [Alphaproteobacteria bacterium AO1-B]
MTIFKETLWDRFFNRLPETAANEAIRALKRGGSYRDVDFFTLKEAEAEVERLRKRAKLALADYRQWKTGQSVNALFDVFRSHEGRALREHARSMTALYSDARHDHRELTDLLMASIANDPTATPTKTTGGSHGQQ